MPVRRLYQQVNTESFRNSSALPYGAAVQLDTAVQFSILPASAASVGFAQTYGLLQATAATIGLSCPVQTGGWGAGVAAASLGIGAQVGPGIGTTGLVPVGASGVAVSSALIKWRVGVALENAAAGQLFTVKIAPGEVV